MKHIASAQNDTLKNLRKWLSQSKARKTDRVMVLEGIHLLSALLQAGQTPQQVLVREDCIGHPEIAACLTQLPAGVAVSVATEAFAKVTALTHAAEIISVVAWPEAVPPPLNGSVVVLENLQDPGNVGTILRSAAAAGVTNVLLSPECVDVYSPKVLRAGMGAHFLLNIHTEVALLPWLAAYQGRSLATALDERAVSVYAEDLRQDVALVFGNEGAGVSAATIAAADQTVIIPMLGQTESLNVAMAATVCLFERMRQIL
ncbi:MAG: RNA methyltransferase [Neisseriaceae bacterium]|nr:RNA methyltransferase [Neisseriaceae bacterium]MBP6863338.1 RNA methyltransferase [Neisseriaceae bacterium]